MAPAGTLTEVYILEKPIATRNAAGESVTTWQAVARIYGSYEQVSFSEQARRGQIGGSLQATVRIHYRGDVTSSMRLRWVSRNNRILMIAAMVEGPRQLELELTVEEQAA